MKLLSIKAVAEQISFTPKTIRKWVAEGKFPAPVVSPSGDHRWREMDVLKWIVRLEDVAANKENKS